MNERTLDGSLAPSRASPRPYNASPPSAVFPMRVLVTSLWLLCLWSGCGIIMVGEPVQKLDISSQDDVEENLKAIRAILADQETRKAPSVAKPSHESSRAAPASESGPVSEPLLPPTPAPSSSSIARGHLDAPATLPWSPSPSQRPDSPDRPVPAYTVPAPVAPGYSGSIRCVPDGLGGQRCAGH